MFIIVFAFLPLSIVNWKIVCRKERYGWRENAPHTQRKKGTIYCVMREDSGTAAVGILAAIAAIVFIIMSKYFNHPLTTKIYFLTIMVELLFFLLSLIPYLYEITLAGDVISRQILNRRKYWNISDIKYCKVKMKSYRMGVYPVIYVYMKGKRLPAFWVSEGQFGFMRFLRCMKFARPRNSKKPVRPIVPLIGKEKLDDYFLRSDI